MQVATEVTTLANYYDANFINFLNYSGQARMIALETINAEINQIVVVDMIETTEIDKVDPDQDMMIEVQAHLIGPEAMTMAEMINVVAINKGEEDQAMVKIMDQLDREMDQVHAMDHETDQDQTNSDQAPAMVITTDH